MEVRTPKKVHSSSSQEAYKYFSRKVEETDTSEVFPYIPEKVLSKEKIKYVVSRTVNRNMLVAIELLKQLKNNNNIRNISSADFEALIAKPLDKFLDGRVIKKQQERLNPFDTPRDITDSFVRLDSTAAPVLSRSFRILRRNVVIVDHVGPGHCVEVSNCFEALGCAAITSLHVSRSKL
uniref:Uncharacterized protein n=1 Tax=Physcomitrium patens TaxID=3218 RepID=A0A7I4AL36_PHYPA